MSTKYDLEVGGTPIDRLNKYQMPTITSSQKMYVNNNGNNGSNTSYRSTCNSSGLKTRPDGAQYRSMKNLDNLLNNSNPPINHLKRNFSNFNKTFVNTSIVTKDIKNFDNPNMTNNSKLNFKLNLMNINKPKQNMRDN